MNRTYSTNKICLVGAFDFINKPTGGQPVKSRELYFALSEKYGKSNITFVDTYGWKKKPISMLRKLNKKALEADILIMLPAHNGVVVFSFLLNYYKRIHGKKIFYDVIGGWLAEKTNNSNVLRQRIKNFDGIWVETTSMKEALIEQGFNNVDVVPNFKNIKCLNQDELTIHFEKPFKVCTFSRVNEQKGIVDAIKAVKQINSTMGEQVLTLDIYGQIDADFEVKFQNLLAENNQVVNYLGIVSPDDSVNVLRNYYLLLFPTRYFTEGIPGTLIDAYASGVPVISSYWKNSLDIFKNHVTGLGFEFGNYEAFYKTLKHAVENEKEIIEMKFKCIVESKRYTRETVIEEIDRLLMSTI